MFIYFENLRTRNYNVFTSSIAATATIAVPIVVSALSSSLLVTLPWITLSSRVARHGRWASTIWTLIARPTLPSAAILEICNQNIIVRYLTSFQSFAPVRYNSTVFDYYKQHHKTPRSGNNSNHRLSVYFAEMLDLALNWQMKKITVFAPIIIIKNNYVIQNIGTGGAIIAAFRKRQLCQKI